MKVQIYVLNKTYIAEDITTGIVAYGDSAQSAQQKLELLLQEYWETKKVIVPITTDNDNQSTRK